MAEAITLKPRELRATQLIQLDMMLEVDRVCREYELRYSLAGGTLLGAVRHKGYIPWDDDADIVLLREDYNKFTQIFPKAADSSKYYFQDMDNTDGYRWGYGKIRRKNSLWIRHGQEHMPFKQEIGIDIFPLDRLPSGKLKEPLHNFHCFVIRKLLWSEVGRFTDESALVRAIYSAMSRLSLTSVIKHYHSFADRHNAPQNRLLRVLMFPTPKGCAHEGRTDWYENYTELEFEGHCFSVMCGYREYLKLKYGDFMKLPRESERKTHPLSKFKLPDDGAQP
jgi:lipopolysaccharide cholinephosphotransferase